MRDKGSGLGVQEISQRFSSVNSFLFILLLPLFISGCVVKVPIPTGVEPLREIVIYGEGENKILLVNINGVISWGRKVSRRGVISSYEPSIVSRVKEELERAEKDEGVRAVVLKVASPGGLVSASEVIWNEIKKFKEKKKIPVVAYISTLGVSGSYYIISHADYIIANPGSTVGSIGVIAMKINVKGLSEKVGFEFEVVKGGKHKDMLFIHRKMTDEERERMQRLIDYYYELFKKRVKEGRGEKLKKSIDEIADGSVMSPEEALSYGLIDGIGDIYTAFEKAAELAGVKSWRVIAYVRGNQRLPSLWADTYGKSDYFLELKKILSPFEFSILYLWPGNI